MWTKNDTCLQFIHKISTSKNFVKSTLSDTYPQYPQCLLLFLLLKEYNKYDKEFLEAIEFHHNDKFSGNNKLLDIIRESDNKN